MFVSDYEALIKITYTLQHFLTYCAVNVNQDISPIHADLQGLSLPCGECSSVRYKQRHVHIHEDFSAMKSPTINILFSVALARRKEFTSDWMKLTCLTQGCCSANINADSDHSWLDTDTESLHLAALIIMYIICTDATFKILPLLCPGHIYFISDCSSLWNT